MSHHTAVSRWPCRKPNLVIRIILRGLEQGQRFCCRWIVTLGAWSSDNLNRETSNQSIDLASNQCDRGAIPRLVRHSRGVHEQIASESHPLNTDGLVT